MHVGIIGVGNIGQALIERIGGDPALSGVSLTALVRAGRSAPVPAAHDMATLVAEQPDLVIECAGHAAVAEYVSDCLRAGIDCVVASVGALSDASLAGALDSAARQGGARLILPAGALGGIDLLAALRPAGITAVRYEGRKPPAAWKGTAAEALVDLDGLTAAAVFFEGSAREAAALYPKNANVAATLALAGIGWDATEVRLVADPAAPGNQHAYSVTAQAADYRVEVTGKPLPGNPRTSATTVLSLEREVRNRVSVRSI